MAALRVQPAPRQLLQEHHDGGWNHQTAFHPAAKEKKLRRRPIGRKLASSQTLLVSEDSSMEEE